jgi:hypothetical protein
MLTQTSFTSTTIQVLTQTSTKIQILTQTSVQDQEEKAKAPDADAEEVWALQVCWRILTYADVC